MDEVKWDGRGSHILREVERQEKGMNSILAEGHLNA
jgi:hypothetical protein